MDIDLTKIMIDATTSAKDALGTQFVQWVLRLVTQSGLSNSTIAELNMLSGQYPGRTLEDQQKIDLIKKMRTAGINV